ncbi:hypothetical protein [Riemerella anatipestifer]|nr:hypothetical protein [Riemerella anatipestifer]
MMNMTTSHFENNLKSQVYNIIVEKHRKSGGHNGVYGVDLTIKTAKSWTEVRKALIELYKENKIQVREGSRGKLFFLKINNLNYKK